MNQSLTPKIKAARRRCVPILSINTPDPAQTVRTVACAVACVDELPAPILQWDLVRGYSGLNEHGLNLKASLVGELGDPTIGQPIAAVEMAMDMPQGTVVVLHMANRFLENASFLQAVWNARDEFKSTNRILVLLGPNISLPAELQNDIYQLDEPLPDANELSDIASGVFADCGLTPGENDLKKSVDAVQGLAAFPAEQAMFLSAKKDGMRHDDLWDRKRREIEKEPALRCWMGGERFADIGGCEHVKKYLRDVVIDGPLDFNAVVFIDEIEKQMGGAGDLSGISQDQNGILLSEMQDNEYDGSIFLGPPGAAKSAIAKCLGNEAGIPTIQLDLGAAKGSLVGQSEAQIRNAFKVIKAVSSGRAFFIATCNGIARSKPEIRRRFTMGTFFFDLPDAAERNKIWALYITKYGLPSSQVLDKPDDEGWTGAEIKQCCRLAWMRKRTLKEAASTVTPVSRAAPDMIRSLRAECDGKYISAKYEGVYTQAAGKPKANGRRAVMVD